MAELFKTPEEHTRFWVRKLAERSARLQRLYELGAPTLILMRERHMVFDALSRIPVDASVLLQADNGAEKARSEEMEFLSKHGYFKDVFGGELED